MQTYVLGDQSEQSGLYIFFNTKDDIKHYVRRNSLYRFS